MIDDFDRCYAAVSSRDPRFDGWFYTGVTSTGIFCRPSCPAVTPRPDNVRFLPTAAAAVEAGFRACRRCRPDATPGSPEWNVRADLVGRAMRLIADGVVDREGVTGLASRLGYSSRQLQRALVGELGAGPLAIARAQRAGTARTLIETTSLPFAQVAFAAGFASIRQFNDTVRAVFATTPTDLRRRAAGAPSALADAVTVRLAHRQPGDVTGTLAFLAARAVPGVEEVTETGLRRSVALPHGAAVVELAPGGAGWCSATLRLDDLRDLGTAVQRCRRLLDLDADPVAVDAHLAADPLLAPLVAAQPGRRVPGTVDGAELAVRALLGQQVSVAAARTLAARLVTAHGEPLERPVGAVTHRFPTPEALTGADLDGLGMPRARAAALRSLAGALAGGAVDVAPGADRLATAASLRALPGIGPWTAAYVAMRALDDPDAFPVGDVALAAGLARLGSPVGVAGLAARAERWRPWRAYAAIHVWGAATPAARVA